MCTFLFAIIMQTSRVPVEGKIISRAAQSLPHKCRPSHYRRRDMSTDWLEALWKPNVSTCLRFVHHLRYTGRTSDRKA